MWDSRDFHNSGNWIFKLVPIFIVIVFLIVFASWIIYGIVGVRLYKEIDKNGAKSVVERIWNGQDTTKK